MGWWQIERGHPRGQPVRGLAAGRDHREPDRPCTAAPPATPASGPGSPRTGPPTGAAGRRPGHGAARPGGARPALDRGLPHARRRRATASRRFAEEVAAGPRRRRPRRARADLAVSLGGPLPAALRRADLPGRAADLLEWVWAETCCRTGRGGGGSSRPTSWRDGPAAGPGRLGGRPGRHAPGMRWLGDSRLQINAYDHPPREISGARLLFVPVTSAHGWVVAGTEPHRYAVVYPCSGVLADAGPRAGARGAGRAARARPGPASWSCWTPRRAPRSWWR